MHFICPYCEKLLTIDEKHLGKRGRCNRCQGRIALLGTPHENRPLRATAVDEGDDSLDEPETPATPAQRHYLKDLGVPEHEAAAFTRSHAETEITFRAAARTEEEPASPKQIEYLQRLGLHPKRLAAVTSKAEASRLIEEMLPPPTETQLEYLTRLGANRGQILGLRSRSQASELIEAILRGSMGKDPR